MKGYLPFLLRGEEILFPRNDQDNQAVIETKKRSNRGELYVTNMRIILVSKRIFRKNISHSLWFRYISGVEMVGFWIWRHILIIYGAGDMPREIKIKTKHLREVYNLLLWLLSGNRAKFSSSIAPL
ncbi:hypothetical protein DRN86_02815 [Candidatus Geothermarchaeota archaeon]|nr:MAG: hypothetical protein DRN86_02815 [Candidatus Geothermarchaeota archaeon]